jgi:hypothetical protein
MPETAPKSARDDSKKTSRTSGWYVLFLAWIVCAAAYFEFFKTLVKPVADITNGQLLDVGHRYGPFIGVALGLISFLAVGLVYLIIRLIRKRPSWLVALILTALGYAPWLVLGWDLVYREPRYAEVARLIITYMGKPMLYSTAIVCGVALLGVVLTLLTLVFKKRAK